MNESSLLLGKILPKCSFLGSWRKPLCSGTMAVLAALTLASASDRSSLVYVRCEPAVVSEAGGRVLDQEFLPLAVGWASMYVYF